MYEQSSRIIDSPLIRIEPFDGCRCCRASEKSLELEGVSADGAVCVLVSSSGAAFIVRGVVSDAQAHTWIFDSTMQAIMSVCRV